MNKQEFFDMVVQLIDEAETMQVYETELWIKVDRGLYDTIIEELYPSHGENND
jgi:hypothetical protein